MTDCIFCKIVKGQAHSWKVHPEWRVEYDGMIERLR